MAIQPDLLAIELGAWTTALLASVGYIARTIRKGTETTAKHIRDLRESMVRAETAASYTARDVAELRVQVPLLEAQQQRTATILGEHLRWHDGKPPSITTTRVT